MNYCTKCSSLYTEPGTCNCYATESPRLVPYVPMPAFPGTSPGQCRSCGGYHVGVMCPNTTAPFETTCEPAVTICGGTYENADSFVVTYQQMQQDLADGSASYTDNHA